MNPSDGAIRPLRGADVEAGLALSTEAGWNQTGADWRFMIGHGRAIGVDEPGRGLVASALVLPLGPRFSWLSMVLVAKDRRRQGLGTTLLRRCIETVQSAGGVPGLDATEQGRPVYGPFGFDDLYPISRWVVARAQPARGEGGAPTVRPMTADDLPAVVAYDEPRSALQRAPILRYLHGQSAGHVAEVDGRLAGYALGRPGRNAAQVGPVVAEDAGTALALIDAALAPVGRFVLDVPDIHGEIATYLQERGAQRERGYMRMTLGPAPELAEPGRIFALAGPELA